MADTSIVPPSSAEDLSTPPFPAPLRSGFVFEGMQHPQQQIERTAALDL